ncbi:MAG: hypothetical protein ACYTF0_00485, partial [Planctomycetota bacterium]
MSGWLASGQAPVQAPTLSVDSRRVDAGAWFVHAGGDVGHVEQACAAGAAGVIAEHGVAVPSA